MSRRGSRRPYLRPSDVVAVSGGGGGGWGGGGGGGERAGFGGGGVLFSFVLLRVCKQWLSEFKSSLPAVSQMYI